MRVAVALLLVSLIAAAYAADLGSLRRLRRAGQPQAAKAPDATKAADSPKAGQAAAAPAAQQSKQTPKEKNSQTAATKSTVLADVSCSNVLYHKSKEDTPKAAVAAAGDSTKPTQAAAQKAPKAPKASETEDDDDDGSFVELTEDKVVNKDLVQVVEKSGKTFAAFCKDYLQEKKDEKKDDKKEDKNAQKDKKKDAQKAQTTKQADAPKSAPAAPDSTAASTTATAAAPTPAPAAPAAAFLEQDDNAEEDPKETATLNAGQAPKAADGAAPAAKEDKPIDKALKAACRTFTKQADPVAACKGIEEQPNAPWVIGGKPQKPKQSAKQTQAPQAAKKTQAPAAPATAPAAPTAAPAPTAAAAAL